MAGVRERLGHELFLRVAGPNGHQQAARIHGRPGPRWFDPGSGLLGPRDDVLNS